MRSEHSGKCNTAQALENRPERNTSSRVRPICDGTRMAVDSIELRRQITALQRENARLKRELQSQRDSLEVLRSYIRDQGLVRGGEAQIYVLPHRGRVR